VTGGGSQRKRTRLDPETRRAQLLAIGLDLIRSEPIDNLTVDTIASRAGVSRTLVFHYFPTVRDLQLACLEAAADDVVAQILEVVKGTGTGHRLAGGLGSFADMMANQPATFLALRRFAGLDDEFAALFDRVRGTIVELIFAYAEVDRTPLIELLLHGWVASVETSIARWFQDPDGVSRDEMLSVLENLAVMIITGSPRGLSTG
jgi:AcrR family transcriptional regulator